MAIIPHTEPELDYELPDWATDWDALKEEHEELSRLRKIQRKNNPPRPVPRREIISLGERVVYYDDGYGGVDEVTEYTIRRKGYFNE